MVSVNGGEPDPRIFSWLAETQGSDFPRLRDYVRVLTHGQSSEAEDVVQIMYQKLVDGSIALTQIPPSDAFLFSVLRGMCANYGRKSARWECIDPLVLADRPGPASGDPAVLVERLDSFSYALEGLSDREREALCLSCSLSNAEIAQVMGLPTTASAANAVYRARRKARTRWNGLEPVRQ